MTKKLRKCNEVCSHMDKEVKMIINSLESYRSNINEKANKIRDSITKLFNEIQNAVHERESQLKQDVSIVLEREEDNINNKLKRTISKPTIQLVTRKCLCNKRGQNFTDQDQMGEIARKPATAKHLFHKTISSRNYYSR